MVPFVFWLVAAVSIFAAGAGMLVKRPLFCLSGLVLLMLANSIIFFLLSIPLLAIELFLGTIGVGLGFWVLLVRPGRTRLEAPGIERFGLSRLISIATAVGFFILFVTTLDKSPEVSSATASSSPLFPGFVGVLATIFLLGGVAATTALLIRFSRPLGEKEKS